MKFKFLLSLMTVLVFNLVSQVMAIASSSQDNRQIVAAPVFYITNRQFKTKKDQTIYGAKRAANLDYGYYTVAAPAHPADPSANVGDPAFSELVSAEELGRSIDNPHRIASKEEFLKTLTAAEEKTSLKKVVVFVHGFDCGLPKAVRMARKMTFAMGLPVVIFSWPARNMPLTYVVDECNAEWSAPQFASALEILGKQFGNNNIILVAHSMGSRIVCQALQTSEVQAREGVTQQDRYPHIFLCSPDLDTGVFVNLAPAIVKKCPDVRVFVSTKDARLTFSKFLHGNSRLGMHDRGRPEMAGLHFVDFTPEDHVHEHAIPYAWLSKIVNTPLSAVLEP